MSSLRKICSNALAVGVLVWSGMASSAMIDFSMEVNAVPTMGGMGMTVTFDGDQSNVMPTANPDVFSAMGMHASMDVWEYNWNLMMDPDPFIGGSFSIRNMSTVTQTFNLLFNLPVSPALSSGYKSGTIGATLTDTGGGGATLSNMTWGGLIDGGNAMNLLTAGTLCFGSSPGCTATVFPVSDGPLFHADGVSTSIGIAMSFDLTAGDTAEFTTNFEVAPVPVPAAVWLFGSGLLGLISVARRKNA